MSVRYIFNSNGDYVAFISGTNLFTPTAEWIGFLPEANIVYNLDGTFMGEVTLDDRIVKNKNTNRLKLTCPFRPFAPFIPFRPLKRLRMTRLPYFYKDVFEKSSQSKPTALITDFSYLLGANIFASDAQRTFLGTIANNRFDLNSIFNAYSTYGSKYSATSIFNQYCPFGGEYGIYSPLNKYSLTPPQIIKDNQNLGWLSVNTGLFGSRIDTNEFFNWFNSLN